MEGPMSRRRFLAHSAAFGAAACLLAPCRSQAAGERQAPRPTVPRIKLGDGHVSRLILDYEPFTGHGHHRYLICKEMFQYYTPEQMRRTLDEAATYGLNAALVRSPSTRTQPIYETARAHAAGDGGVRDLLYEIFGKRAGLESAVRRSGRLEHVTAVCIAPRLTDPILRGGDWRDLRSLLEDIRKQEKLVCAATARPEHLARYDGYVKKSLLPIDCYLLTACPTDDYQENDRTRALEALAGISRPVIVRRIMHADTPAREGERIVRQAFTHLAHKDGLCLSVFTRNDLDQLRRYARLVAELSQG